MNKLKKLTDEQVTLMEVIKNKWLGLFFNGKELDKKEAEKGIKWLYSFSNLKEPRVIFVDSPLGAQYAVHMLKNMFSNKEVRGQVRDQVRDQVSDQVGDQVWGQVRDQVRDQVSDQVGDQVWGQVRDQVRGQVSDQVRDQVRDQVSDQVGGQVEGQVWDQVWGQVRDQVRDQVSDQVRGQVGDQKLEYFSFSSYGSISDLGWLSFYDFFDEIGIDLGEAQTNLKKFMNLMEAGVYDMIQLEGVCIVCSYPKSIRRNQLNALHDAKLPAIEWADGYKLYYLNGVNFDEALFEKVTSRTITLEEVLKIEDIDQRKQAMRFINVWDFIKEAKGKEIDTYVKIGAKDGREVKYWLYEFPASSDLFPTGAKYAVYEDSMVGKAEYHMQGVLMEHMTVPEAFAWKQSDELYTVTPAQWEALQLDVDFT